MAAIATETKKTAWKEPTTVDLAAVRDLLAWAKDALSKPDVTDTVYAGVPQREHDMLDMARVVAQELGGAVEECAEWKDDVRKVVLMLGSREPASTWKEFPVRCQVTAHVACKELPEFLRVLRAGESNVMSLNGALDFVWRCAHIREETERTVDMMAQQVESQLPKIEGGKRQIHVRVRLPEAKERMPETGGLPDVTVEVYARRMPEAEVRAHRTVAHAVARMQTVLLSNLPEGDVLQLHTLRMEKEFVELMDKVEGRPGMSYHQSFDVETEAGDLTPTCRSLYDRVVESYSEALACNVLLWRNENKPTKGQKMQLVVGVWGGSGLDCGVYEVHMRAHIGPVPEPKPEQVAKVEAQQEPAEEDREKRSANEAAFRASGIIEGLLREKLHAKDTLEVAWMEAEPVFGKRDGGIQYEEKFLVDSPVDERLVSHSRWVAINAMARLCASLPLLSDSAPRHVVVAVWAEPSDPALTPQPIEYGPNMKLVHVRAIMTRQKV